MSITTIPSLVAAKCDHCGIMQQGETLADITDIQVWINARGTWSHAEPWHVEFETGTLIRYEKAAPNDRHLCGDCETKLKSVLDEFFAIRKAEEAMNAEQD